VQISATKQNPTK